MKILFVCLGNICRSPTAEVVLRTIAAREMPELTIEVDSAGTAGYHIGAPPDPRTQQAAIRRGYDLSKCRARVIAPSDVEPFEMILAMEPEHLEALRRRAPAPARGRVEVVL